MPERMTEKEQLIFNLIQKNPYVSQQELAEKLGLSRPTIANLISGLMKKGHIVGRAYVLNEAEQIICIGGAVLDRKFHIKDKTQLGTSNPVRSTMSAGGVARNIAENLGRLGLDVSLLTTYGTESDWSFIDQTSSPYMKLDLATAIPNAATGTYYAVLDSSGDLVIAMADMDVFDAITPDLLQKYDGILKQAKCMVADLNCSKEALQYLCQLAKSDEKPLVLIPVSSPKMKNLPEDLEGVTWMITNRDETEQYFNLEIKTHEDWQMAMEKWLAAGIKNVIITNGKEGALIGNKAEGIFHAPAIETKEIVDVTGAGDSFSSAVIYSWLAGKSLPEIARAGNVNAAKTLQSAYTVRKELSADQFEKDMEE
jgi:pseudouridine kinase